MLIQIQRGFDIAIMALMLWGPDLIKYKQSKIPQVILNCHDPKQGWFVLKNKIPQLSNGLQTMSVFHRGLRNVHPYSSNTVFEATQRTSESFKYGHQQGHMAFSLGQGGKILSPKLPRAYLFPVCSCCLSWKPMPIKWKINEIVFSTALGNHIYPSSFCFPSPNI